MSDPTAALPERLRRVHMVGIGGAGMSGIARILLARGGQVSGSDAKESRGVVALRARGAQVQVGHSADALDLLPGGPTVVVTTHAAIPKDNPELVEAHRRGIPVILRPEVLADLMEGYRTLLVSGTHGKTSTTSMAVVGLQHCGGNPSFAVGGELNESGTNAFHGTGDVFVAEADESDGSLLQYSPDVVVVTNVEADHLDFFGSEEKYVAVFDAFTERIRPGGTLVVCLDDPGSAALGQRTHAALRARGVRVFGYGEGTHRDLAPDVTLIAELLDYKPRAEGGMLKVRFSDENRQVTERAIMLSVPGKHMALNAIAATIAVVNLGYPTAKVIAGIESFGGVHRRFQLRGTEDGVRVFDDYAHHPTEVRAVLTAAAEMVAKQAVPGRVIVAFQPHLYSRTEQFAAEFAEALSLADHVVALDVYGAREAPLPGITGERIAEKVTTDVTYVPSQADVAGTVVDIARPGDVVITMGAGDVTMQGPAILSALAQRGGGAAR
ncbi:UDP-N-acetylmuramate--L-alanine ligase OS=Tsukamurella paurometabola (strain ATCC 8368 / DSM/ CCUG 35730 / CIP 100753 / JCM 10117 / KCTC 9821 / NBRC 16120/ NCIMB 702349 / NCTC 13040) OX=521096 GN=murC PE=3 SV=1 [Tsukamurella paurometabola]|uniref:UDP-N-acetylmuramate--L-alanine ligase n=1 Tax=Tsukamurella paurometabola (strain ATCC 8368 / DSM 20162 / CCUG 35730 / CIP 100753 / JCM 10117 / KCTC 9821 / NBRC 16120 / NCIMB 702349 / NCTC 13040) TaxID=521096 RepID=D5USH4_TSUPD|nr:UDP-N-acetylmuramate--L-alanine ligase [Tsukamurella paurometabola]ADG79245.1 UDP-N-acetylmuramate/alanine ligase [Tsukamurella paurometabola DSM 20162]SUP34739.1 UDP-N-acetylmuramate--L-alanine ligase [Tsukamurella paurometabola]